MTEYYKILSKDGKSPYKSTYWTLPKDGEPGEWMPPVVGDLEECGHGYHVVTADHILDWLDEECIFKVEVRGEVLAGDTKVVVREARLLSLVDSWNERTQRLFACDCAERVLHLYEKQYPWDDRPRKAIEVARRFADGKASAEELDAARDAARDAAWAARAAGAAWVAWAAWAARDAWDAAWAAAWAAWDAWAAWAARDAARAARDAAGDAERKWQNTRLLEYLNGEHDD